MKKTLLLVLFLLGWVLSSPAQTRAQRERQARYRDEIALIGKALRANEASGRDASERLSLINTDIALREGLLTEIGLQIDSVGQCIAEREDSLALLQSRYEDLQDHFNRLLRQSYRHRDGRTWLLYILSGRSASQAVRRAEMLKRLSHSLEEQAGQVQTVRREMEQQRDSLLAMRTQLEGVKASREEEARLLRNSRSEVQQLISQLRQDRQRYNSQLTQKKAELASLENEIARAIAQAARKNATPSQGKSGSSGKTGSSASASAGAGKVVDNTVDQRLSAHFEGNKGKLPWPVRGSVCESFGSHRDPVSGGTYNINGVELVTQPSAVVTAVFDGTVEKVLYMEKYHHLVMVRHGNYYTLYCKMGTVSVREGEKVKTGQTLGTVITSGGQTRFHFELWKSGTGGNQALNPSLWLKR